eukprot:GHVP01050961.1.p1 GENE.GHVP01050961.1~~GHVP01050961.1.p1  ORF type:complete len:1738 (+),score=239.64 GHVP01050961.1:1120-6333(+)
MFSHWKIMQKRKASEYNLRKEIFEKLGILRRFNSWHFHSKLHNLSRLLTNYLFRRRFLLWRFEAIHLNNANAQINLFKSRKNVGIKCRVIFSWLYHSHQMNFYQKAEKKLKIYSSARILNLFFVEWKGLALHRRTIVVVGATAILNSQKYYLRRAIKGFQIFNRISKENRLIVAYNSHCIKIKTLRRWSLQVHLNRHETSISDRIFKNHLKSLSRHWLLLWIKLTRVMSSLRLKFDIAAHMRSSSLLLNHLVAWKKVTKKRLILMSLALHVRSMNHRCIGLWVVKTWRRKLHLFEILQKLFYFLEHILPKRTAFELLKNYSRNIDQANENSRIFSEKSFKRKFFDRWSYKYNFISAIRKLFYNHQLSIVKDYYSYWTEALIFLQKSREFDVSNKRKILLHWQKFVRSRSCLFINVDQFVGAVELRKTRWFFGMWIILKARRDQVREKCFKLALQHSYMEIYRCFQAWKNQCRVLIGLNMFLYQKDLREIIPFFLFWKQLTERKKNVKKILLALSSREEYNLLLEAFGLWYNKLASRSFIRTEIRKKQFAWNRKRISTAILAWQTGSRRSKFLRDELINVAVRRTANVLFDYMNRWKTFYKLKEFRRMKCESLIKQIRFCYVREVLEFWLKALQSITVLDEMNEFIDTNTKRQKLESVFNTWKILSSRRRAVRIVAENVEFRYLCKIERENFDMWRICLHRRNRFISFLQEVLKIYCFNVTSSSFHEWQNLTSRRNLENTLQCRLTDKVHLSIIDATFRRMWMIYSQRVVIRNKLGAPLEQDTRMLNGASVLNLTKEAQMLDEPSSPEGKSLTLLVRKLWTQRTRKKILRKWIQYYRAKKEGKELDSMIESKIRFEWNSILVKELFDVMKARYSTSLGKEEFIKNYHCQFSIEIYFKLWKEKVKYVAEISSKADNFHAELSVRVVQSVLDSWRLLSENQIQIISKGKNFSRILLNASLQRNFVLWRIAVTRSQVTRLITIKVLGNTIRKLFDKWLIGATICKRISTLCRISAFVGYRSAISKFQLNAFYINCRSRKLSFFFAIWNDKLRRSILCKKVERDLKSRYHLHILNRIFFPWRNLAAKLVKFRESEEYLFKKIHILKPFEVWRSKASFFALRICQFSGAINHLERKTKRLILEKLFETWMNEYKNSIVKNKLNFRVTKECFLSWRHKFLHSEILMEYSLKLQKKMESKILMSFLTNWAQEFVNCRERKIILNRMAVIASNFHMSEIFYFWKDLTAFESTTSHIFDLVENIAIRNKRQCFEKLKYFTLLDFGNRSKILENHKIWLRNSFQRFRDRENLEKREIFQMIIENYRTQKTLLILLEYLENKVARNRLENFYENWKHVQVNRQILREKEKHYIEDKGKELLRSCWDLWRDLLVEENLSREKNDRAEAAFVFSAKRRLINLLKLMSTKNAWYSLCEDMARNCERIVLGRQKHQIVRQWMKFSFQKTQEIQKEKFLGHQILKKFLKIWQHEFVLFQLISEWQNKKSSSFENSKKVSQIFSEWRTCCERKRDIRYLGDTLKHTRESRTKKFIFVLWMETVANLRDYQYMLDQAADNLEDKINKNIARHLFKHWKHAYHLEKAVGVGMFVQRVFNAWQKRTISKLTRREKLSTPPRSSPRFSTPVVVSQGRSFSAAVGAHGASRSTPKRKNYLDFGLSQSIDFEIPSSASNDDPPRFGREESSDGRKENKYKENLFSKESLELSFFPLDNSIKREQKREQKRTTILDDSFFQK